MNLFFDTSALIKAFYQETGTEMIDKLFLKKNTIYISELTRIEFKSAFYRRFSNGQVSETDLQVIFEDFDEFITKINVETLRSVTLLEAENLFNQYHSYGLRTLDALQFASFMLLDIDDLVFVSADNKLCNIVKLTGKQTFNPVFDTI